MGTCNVRFSMHMYSGDSRMAGTARTEAIPGLCDKPNLTDAKHSDTELQKLLTPVERHHADGQVKQGGKMTHQG